MKRKPLTSLTILVDTREQAPYQFDNVDCKISTQTRGLKSGDYSLPGLEDRIAVERKSVEDCVSTIFHGRQRFQRELQRLQDMEFAAVVVEGEWMTMLKFCENHTRGTPKSIDSSIIAWQQRYPGVHWLFRPGRHYAEITTFKVLERFQREHG